MMSSAATCGLVLIHSFGWHGQKREQRIEQIYGILWHGLESEAVTEALSRSGTDGLFLEPHGQHMKFRVGRIPVVRDELHQQICTH